MIAQEARLNEFLAMMQGPWTVVSDSWHSAHTNGGIYCALTKAENREKVLSHSSWDLSKGSHGPGFSQRYGEDGAITTYHASTAGDEMEPLVLHRPFHGTRDDIYEIDQQFRLFHNLAPSDTGLVVCLDDGSEHEAVKNSGDRVEIRTPLLRRYLAARQMALILFIDSVQFDHSADELPGAKTYKDDTTCIELNSARGSWRQRNGVPFSRMLGKRMALPGPIESCGVWPYEQTESFPKFVFAEDDDGAPLEFSCDPDQLANYFGANPESPHYLTPIFFRRAVLKKYYDDPRIYEVDDGALWCGSRWMIRIDNDLPDFVSAFLGDLGRDLPSSERDYWRGFMVPPSRSISDTNFSRSFLNQPTWPESHEFAFKRSLTHLSTTWEDEASWPLFIDPAGDQLHQLRRLRIPLDKSQEEFELAIRLLALLLVDRLNEKQIGRYVAVKDGVKGIGKLQALIASQPPENPPAEDPIPILRSIQEIRSKFVVHLKTARADEVLQRNLGNLRGPEAISSLMDRATRSFSHLEEWIVANGPLVRQGG